MFRPFLLLSFFMISVAIQAGFAQEILSEWEISNQLKALRAFKVQQDEKFMDPAMSPLPKDSIKVFNGLQYFPFNAEMIVEAEYRRIDGGKTFEMKTTTARLPLYKDFAVLKFSIEGLEYSLHAYQNLELSKKPGYEDQLFIPFTDHTNGELTYGGGRYIDIKISDKEFIILDFNMSYNPYCAYNEKYSCPVPPEENRLEVPIKAGVYKYH